ncbi:MAG: type 1 glutamine amidotransferase [Bacteroidales bacterium]|nr:type 1 glutamine amidotransferase [Bacteroidales bacterium]
MRIHHIQHDDFEGLAAIGEWAAINGAEITSTRADLGHSFPDQQDFDMLVIMGGKMGVYEEDKFPWLIEEKKFIAKSIQNGKLVLGICLGSQLIASALGARVFPNLEPEMGVFPVYFNESAASDPVFSHFGKQLDVLHIHNDTFDLPEGAVCMASSMLTPNQAFKYGSNVFALQFHFEVNQPQLIAFRERAFDENLKGRWIQTATAIMSYSELIQSNKAILYKVLDSIAIMNNPNCNSA